MTLDNPQLCQWFLSHGADPNARCEFDITPLSYAIQKASREMIDMLFQHGGSIEKGQLLHWAVHRPKLDCQEVVRMLLDKGCEINAIRYQNHSESYEFYNLLSGLGTPLHEAAEYGRLALVEFLLANGANALIRDTWGALAIDRARSKGHTEIVDILTPHSESKPRDLQK
jgi:ankyrin repeat protein